MRRLALGLILIALTSGVLLLSDWRQRKGAPENLRRIAIVQHASQKLVDEGVSGILDGLAEGGFINGRNISIQRFNAENDGPTENAIAKQVTDGSFDLVVTATTLSLQAVANANRNGKTRHVFGLVSDPFGAGVGVSRANPLDHPKHLTGIGTMQPVEEAFRMAKKVYPNLKSVGVAWNPAESNSEANTKIARKVCGEMGIELLEANVDNSSAVAEAASSLVSRGAQALWLGGDLTVLVAVDAVIATAKRGWIPVFTNLPDNARKGALFDVGADYTEVGRLVGDLAAKVLRGTDPANVPVKNVIPERLVVNRLVLADLKDPWRIPEDLLARANLVVDENGVHERAARARTPLSLGKKWNVNLIELNNILDVEETEQGIFEALREKLVEGRDFEVKIRNAQGDMATVNGLVDAALSDQADILITLSTPTLQVALRRVQKVPVVFTYVSSAIAAGAARTLEDHAPNFTGVEMIADYDKIFALLKQCVPSARRVGTLFVPAEVNMVINKESMVTEGKKAGIEVIPVAVGTSTDVPDAALAMTGRGIDVVCQIPGNLTAASFGGIAQAARKAKLPVFAFQKSQLIGGAAVVLARDYHDAGKEAGYMAARIMRGENPAKMPIVSFQKSKLMINLEAAQAVGLQIPASLMQQAEILGK